MAQVRCFPPIEGSRAYVLILGTMPGARSRELKQYYAHPRNAMWRTLEPWAGSGDYEERGEELSKTGIAMWDVIATCDQTGSADATIQNPTPTDIAGFCVRHPELRAFLFNGKKARQFFDQRVQVGDERVLVPDGVELRTMPSTSPANARKGKAEAWRAALEGILCGTEGIDG